MFRPRYHIDDKPSVLIIKLFIHVRNFLKIFEHNNNNIFRKKLRII